VGRQSLTRSQSLVEDRSLRAECAVWRAFCPVAAILPQRPGPRCQVRTHLDVLAANPPSGQSIRIDVNDVVSASMVQPDHAAPVVSGTTDVGDCRLHASARIDRYAHRVGPRGIIGRYVDVEFDLVATPMT
jgi:hypothetical protein